ncbi:MAG: DUF58 domain-containing protein [Rubrivivax sp.]|nr:DUF58 domain-containing protein [Rubrivivax sp.]MBK7261880.1 DUF58 domain-containing protein [Rubrivivax sp.]MBK8528049.1 DUF58 domain-containing protein [Rubrivivax sp.]
MTPAAPAPRRRSLSQRVQRWWLQRLPLTDSWTLTQSNIYILPTKAGIVFAVTLLLMLLASINYQLNLGYALTFLLAGSGLVSMHLTHGTLRGLTLHLRPTPSVFAGDAALLEVVLTNPGAERHGVALYFEDRERHGTSWVWTDVPAQGQASARLAIVPATRGRHAVPTVIAESLFPFGLFRAWTLWRPAAQVLAWPRPESPPPPLPAGSPRPDDHQPQTLRREGAELDGVRAWRRGDSLRQVLWKKVARSGELVSRDTAGVGTQELHLDWQSARVAGTEQRLARLAAWVLAADHAGQVYRLQLPGQNLPAGQGDSQRRAALDALALWDAP